MHDRATDLLLAIARADKASVRQLYDLVAVKLLGISMRMLGNRQEAEDLVQDVFVTVWRKAAEFDPTRAGGEAWLVAITRNRCIDRLRARGKRQFVPDTALEKIADPAASASRGAEQADVTRSVNLALSEIDPRHASIIRSAYLDGLSYDELSQREGVPVATIKTWVFRGLRHMRTKVMP